MLVFTRRYTVHSIYFPKHLFEFLKNYLVIFFTYILLLYALSFLEVGIPHIISFFDDILQDFAEWLFTSKKTDKVRPFTMHVNFDKFSEGLKMNMNFLFLVHMSFISFLFTILHPYTFAGILVGDELVIDGGMATFEVTEKTGNDLRCKCTDPGLLLPRAKLSFWRDGKLIERNFGLPTLSAKVKLRMQYLLFYTLLYIGFIVPLDFLTR
jgi:hypothetical protein